MTASIGVATLPATAIDVRELIAAADAALYEAKRTGKNRVVGRGGGAYNARSEPMERAPGVEGTGARTAKVGSKPPAAGRPD